MSLRNVALVVTGIEPDAADRLLQQFPADVEQAIRDEVLSLGPIDPAEQRSAIESFLNGASGLLVEAGLSTRGDAVSHAMNGISAAEGTRFGTSFEAPRAFDTSPSRSDGADSRRAAATRPATAGDRPIDVASERLIAECLCNEIPQAIAVALAQLPTRRASEVVSHLPAELQASVLERMVAIDPIALLELASVRDSFQTWLHEQVERALHRSELAARLATILGATNAGTRERILNNVSLSDAGLAKELHHQLAAVSPV